MTLLDEIEAAWNPEHVTAVAELLSVARCTVRLLHSDTCRRTPEGATVRMGSGADILRTTQIARCEPVRPTLSQRYLSDEAEIIRYAFAASVPRAIARGVARRYAGVPPPGLLPDRFPPVSERLSS